jgi:single-strand DNA-binding protein
MAGRSLNKVMLIGNLTRDPNLRFTPTGTAVCSFGIATNRSWTPSDGGEKQDRVDFHNIVAWSKLAEICGQFLHKGDKVYVEGRIQTRDWKTEEGVEKRITEIVIDNMMMLSGRGGSNAGGEDMGGSDDGDSMAGAMSAAPSTSARAKTKPAPKTDNEVSAVEDVSDDIPF